MSESAYLVFREESEWNEVFRLTSDKVTTIGRAPTNTVVLKDDRCSRLHGEISYHEDRLSWFIQDLQSRNGTSVNGRKISAESPHPLQPGDLLQFGKSQLVFLYDLHDIPSGSYAGNVLGLPTREEHLADAERAMAGEGSGVLENSHVLSGSPEIAEETMITCRRDRAKLFETVELDRPNVSNTAGKRIRRSVASLCRLAIEISRLGDLKEKMNLALRSLLRELPVDHAAILLFQNPVEKQVNVNELEVVVASTEEGGTPYQRVSDYLAQTVLLSRNAVIARHVRGDSILGRRNSAGIIETTSVICAPIFTNDERWGVVHVYSTNPQNVPDEQDLDFTIGVAEILGVSLENLSQQTMLAARLTSARNENADLRKRLGVQSEIVGTSPQVEELTEQIALAAGTRATVLIRGESGVGKELVARAVHYSSQRTKAPFICLNCAALAEDLLASELFGHERGAFTGATDKKIGKFEAADGGTLMLDEIGEMSLNIQSKFLRVLEGHPFERVGGNKPISVDVRVIAATNRDLEQEVMAGRFRKDLFFRLRVVEILVPPLRDRGSDIPQLAEHFFQRFRNETGRKLQGFTPEALARLQQYAWPGNIRELKNVVERAVVLARGTYIEANDLLLSNLSGENPAGGASVQSEIVPGRTSTGEFRPASLEDVELEHIRRTLEFTEGNKSRAAQLLGIERTTLDRKLKKISD